MDLRTRSQKLAEILESVDLPPREPTSAVKALREEKGLGQQELANETGVSQGHLSVVESGRKPLTAAVALKVAPALGMSADGLMTAERVAALQRLALKGRLDPEPLFRAVQDLGWSLPDGELADSLVDALLSVLKLALESYDEERGVGMSTKTRDDRPRRNRRGVRLDKPHGFDPGSYEAPERDAHGRRRNKPHAPNSPRNRR